MSNNDRNSPPIDGPPRQRRSSVTQQTFNSIFGGRSNSTSGAPTASLPGPITTAVAQDQRRRMSISTLGLSGTSPTTTFPLGARRGSVSTAGSDSIDENAIDDEEGPSRSNPTTPFTRRMSFGTQALRRGPPNGSPGTNGEGGGFNWSEQLRSRAESSVSQSQRPSFSNPPPATKQMPMHERQKSVSEMPAPPAAVAAPTPPKPARKQPDAFQERILKGDFYMD